MKCSAGIMTFILSFLSAFSFSQCKTYSFDKKRDTVNCTDFQNLKQGYWITRITDNHGEPGFQEEGVYKNNLKEGYWMRFNLMGDVIAEENYKWGYKDGLCRYYNLLGLLREESWRAINPEHPYDTVRAYHLDNPDKYDLKIMKVDASTVKHGTWTYYNAERQTIVKTEEYVIDQLITNKPKAMTGDSSGVQKNSADSLAASKKSKPAEVLQYEKKNANKKKIKVRDGATGVD